MASHCLNYGRLLTLLKAVPSSSSPFPVLSRSLASDRRPPSKKSVGGKDGDRSKVLDRLGTWDTRLDLPLGEESSIRRGVPLPDLRASEVGVAVSLGRRPYMEDRHSIVQMSDDLLLLAVWDGHGGNECADFCAQQVASHLERRLREAEQDKRKRPDLTVALAKTVVDLNNSFERYWESQKWVWNAAEGGSGAEEKLSPPRSPGSTATIALIRDGYELVVAQVGDSRALLCRDGEARKMSEDHCPSLPEERRRIEAAGGFVESDNIGRHLVNGRLSMSRSIGDLDLKPFGVTPAADIRRRNIKHGKDRFLILFTDGVSYVLTDREVLDCISRCDQPQEAAEKLVDQALLFASEDNITVLVMPLGSWGKGNEGGTSVLFSLGRNMSNSSRYG